MLRVRLDAAAGRGAGARRRRRGPGPHPARAGPAAVARAPAGRPPDWPGQAYYGRAAAGATQGLHRRRHPGRRAAATGGSLAWHTLVDIDVHETEFHIYDHDGDPLAAIPRTSGKEVTRTNGYGVRDRIS
jgi:hypothetical protein